MASKNTSIALGKPFTDFARRKVESGEFGSTSEVVREAMRRYVAEDIEIERIRKALIESENSGPSQEWSLDAFLDERRRKP
jgi:antitoxin ParD1/3/4